MKIFFLCRTGHHTALIAAGLYLGLIHEKNTLKESVSRLRGFDKIKSMDIGTPYFVGKDKQNNEIYTIGIAKANTLMERAVNELINIMGIDPHDRQIINVSHAVSGWTKLGLVVKNLRFKSLAGVFFYLGARTEFNRLQKFLIKVA